MHALCIRTFIINLRAVCHFPRPVVKSRIFVRQRAKWNVGTAEVLFYSLRRTVHHFTLFRSVVVLSLQLQVSAFAMLLVIAGNSDVLRSGGRKWHNVCDKF
jgi:hypothetical protein